MDVRMSKDDLTQFFDKFDCKVIMQHGRVIKEFAEVPGVLLDDAYLIVGYLGKSLKYMMGLKPKGGKNK